MGHLTQNTNSSVSGSLSSRSYTSMSSKASTRSFSCATVHDECIFHTSVQSHNLFQGSKGIPIQVHILRRAEYPHTPYLYCYSNDQVDNYIEFPAYRPTVARQATSLSEVTSETSSSRSATIVPTDFSHHIAEIVYDYDFGEVSFDEGKRVALFHVRPSWTTKPVNLILNFETHTLATAFMRHLLGATVYESAGETNCLYFEPRSFRLGRVGANYPPHEGLNDRVSSVHVYKDVNERRRAAFFGEGHCFSGWIHGHPTTPAEPPSMDIIMNMQIAVVGRKVQTSKYTVNWDEPQAVIYLSKFKYTIESQVNIYFQDITDMATDFSRVGSGFIRGQLLCERDVDFVFQTNYGLREEEKRDATLYLCHRSSGDIAFQRLIRPKMFGKQPGTLNMLTDGAQYDTECAMVLYIRFRNWAQVVEVSACDIKRDNIDPCTVRLTNQPPKPRRVYVGENDSDKFPFWPLDDYLRQEDSFQLSRIRFRTREDTDFFIRQKSLLQPRICNLCKVRSKRQNAANFPPEDMQTSLKSALMSSLAVASMITLLPEDEETSQLIHPYSHTVKAFLQRQKRALLHEH
ncbi:hypothetical protein H072_8060 [Dactylellina haptotyla CBS 200.50]|uniref:Uncharacterized protein n=1 Tax=Dactylellina haptotyla (strain CBS 200.50) TaxID=1284197 RepID=S8BG85_DACHA|nr:hypothetical protein H072_8060 [Dactylellina haptotyla CBS 200.50]